MVFSNMNFESPPECAPKPHFDFGKLPLLLQLKDGDIDECGQKLWEQGFPDYMGAHAFDNILQRLQHSVGSQAGGIVVNIIEPEVVGGVGGGAGGALKRAGSEDPDPNTGPVTNSPVTDLSENSVHGDEDDEEDQDDEDEGGGVERQAFFSHHIEQQRVK